MTQVVYEQPTFYLIALIVTGIIGGIINLYTIYLIIWISPITMKTYRWFILFYQLQSTLLEFFLHIIGAELFFPALFGKVHGILYTWFHLSAVLHFEIAAYLIVMMVMSSASCFFYRHRLLLTDEHWCRFSPRSWLIIFLSLLTAWLSSLCSGIGQITIQRVPEATGLKTLLETYPQFAFVSTDPDMWVIDMTTLAFPQSLQITAIRYTEILILCITIGIVITLAVLVGHVSYLLNRPAIHMSMKTQAMHKRLCMVLFVQILIPFISVAFPFVFYLFLIVFNIVVDQSINNAGLVLLACHGMFGAILICALTEPYRVHAKLLSGKVLGLKFAVEDSTKVTVVISVVQSNGSIRRSEH